VLAAAHPRSNVASAGDMDEIMERATRRCVEAGLLPDGVLALYPVSPIVRGRRILAFVCASFAGATIVQLALGLHGAVIFGVAFAVAGLFGVGVTPTVRSADEGARRPAVVVTAKAILKREERGFRTWVFTELAYAQLSLEASRMDLVLVDGKGRRSFLECGALESGRRLIDAVALHLPIVRV
jgi:hypothetical protein